jgi:general secretion pathway protein G
MMVSRKGFSLIEIMIALLIMGVMMAGVMSYFSWVGRAKRTKTIATLISLKAAIETFQGDTNEYPTSLLDLTTRPADDKVAHRWAGPYMDKDIRTDGWGSEIQYVVNQRGTQPPFNLYSWGKNKEGAPEEEWISVWAVES